MLLYLAHGVELLLSTEFLVSIQRILWIAYVFAEVLVAFRLLREGLLRKYPFFVAFLLAEPIGSLFMLQTNVRSLAYTEAFRIFTLVMTVFRLGVAGELYERICEHFPGIGRFRVGLAAALVLIAGLATVFTFRPDLVDNWALPQTMVEAIHRFQSEILAGALLLTWIFLRFVLSIRQPFQPNVMNHWRIATTYFGVGGAAYLVILLTQRTHGDPDEQYRDAVGTNRLFLCVVPHYATLRRRTSRLPPAFSRTGPGCGTVQPGVAANGYVVAR